LEILHGVPYKEGKVVSGRWGQELSE
jgi:hypothetical protein